MPDAEFGCRFLEIDYSGIEGVTTGWFCQSKEQIRIAKLGEHAALASHILKRPYDPDWSDEEIGRYFREIKKADVIVYDRSKRTNHGYHYGLTSFGMARNWPEIYPSLKVAQEYVAILEQMTPQLPAWHLAVMNYADLHGFIGGCGGPPDPDNPKRYRNVEEFDAPGQAPFGHPYGRKHWFWSIYMYKRLTHAEAMNTIAWHKKRGQAAPVTEINSIWYRIQPGEDANRAKAFQPQSSAADILDEATLRLLDPDGVGESYIGDAYFGRTPLRAPIHDSLLLEVPVRVFDYVLESVCREMLREIREMPIPAEWGMGPYLTIGIEAKASGVGGSWDDVTTIEMPTAQELGVASDRLFEPSEEEDREDMADLEVVA